jgi:hypothetical protein
MQGEYHPTVRTANQRISLYLTGLKSKVFFSLKLVRGYNWKMLNRLKSKVFFSLKLQGGVTQRRSFNLNYACNGRNTP